MPQVASVTARGPLTVTLMWDAVFPFQGESAGRVKLEVLRIECRSWYHVVKPMRSGAREKVFTRTDETNGC